MHRQTSSRNQRSKSIKVKYILQVCLLLAVCFWLIYQVKRSHDKKKEFDESDAKISQHEEVSNGFGNLGRKGILPRVDETSNKNNKHDEATEEEETAEEEVDEPEDKVVENEAEEKVWADEEINVHELEKPDAEAEGEEDIVEDENKEESEENETEDNKSELSVGHTDQDGDHQGTHDAREENYKADDASSAVTHDTQIGASRNAKEHEENSNEHPENILEQDNKENNGDEMNKGENWKELEVEDGETAKDHNQSNVTIPDTKESTLDISEDEEAQSTGGRLETSNNSTEGETENHLFSLQSVTESESNSKDSSYSSLTIQTNNSTVDVVNKNSDSNSTGSTETEDAELKTDDFSNSSNNTESSTSQAFIRTGNNIESSAEENDTVDISDNADGTHEVSEESEITENPEEVQHDAIDLSDSSNSANSLEEKDVRTDLGTLPEMQTEGTNSEDDTAAE